MLSLLLATAMATAPAGTPAPWHDGLTWHGMFPNMHQADGGQYTLAWNFGERVIPAPRYAADTASTLFNGLYAMAQDDLSQDSVTAIRDGAFDHGQPIPCHCFETGRKWPYVWTRDLAYAVDLGLWRFDAARSRNGLSFKVSDVRGPAAATVKGPLVMEDTGSGGSWPISTDRVVWFLGARHLLDDRDFARHADAALVNTLAQDRDYAFDASMGLYRGETSFLDWRQQTYPAWTADNVVAIAQSFALSTNVLHYRALELAATLASKRGDAAQAKAYRAHALALKQAINAHFWRNDRGMYMSYIGGDGAPYDTYDMLGIALAITSGVADEARARQALSNYPSFPAGTPVIWPERSDQPVYHNRALWPFVSAYALRAARVVNDPARIAAELRSIMRGAALSGSNYENYELLTQGIHVDEGELSGPVVNSPRQLWSVGGYMQAVTEGVFGLEADGTIEPKLPVSLVPMLFGQRKSISLDLPGQRIVLTLPTARTGNLLVADRRQTKGTTTTVQLKAITVAQMPLRSNAPLYAPIAPAAPKVTAQGNQWQIQPGDAPAMPGMQPSQVATSHVLYVNGKRMQAFDGTTTLKKTEGLQCISVTASDVHQLESLHSPGVCVGHIDELTGEWPRQWKAPRAGRYRAWLHYDNGHGSIQTGVTAAVKKLVVTCEGRPPQRLAIVMPHSVATQASTWVSFEAPAGASCQFTLDDGFNMSYLKNFAHYTGGEGGSSGPLNQADVHALMIAPLAPPASQP